MTTLTSCLRRYAVGSAPVRSARWAVADQTSSTPSVSRASTASISTQSSRGTRTSRSMSVALLLAHGRGWQDRAVRHERRQPLRGRGARDRRPVGVDGLAVHAVQRLPDLADRVARGAGAGAGLGDHHDDDVVLVVGRDPRRRLLAVHLGRAGLAVDVHLVEREAAELPGERAGLRRAEERLVDVVDARGRGVDLALHRRLDLADQGAVGADDRLADPRLVERAAVGERGVRAGELQRRDDRVALADRVVHGVAGAVVVALEAELVGEDVQEVALAGPVGVDAAVVVLHRRVVRELPLAVGDPAAGLAGQVDAGPGAEAEVLRLGDERVLRVDVLRVGAVLLPVAQADAVEERVAGELERPVEADHPVGRRLVVLEPAGADLQARGAVQARVGAEAVVERADGHDRLPGRAGRELALRGPAEQRVVRALVVEARELLLADPTDPDRGVVRRLAGHRDDPAGLGLHDHDRAGVGDVVPAGHLVEGRARLLDRRVQLLLDEPLHLRVDARHQGRAGLPGDLAVVAEHPAHGVDRDAAVARHAAQPPVVLLLDAGPADRRGAVDRGVVLGLGGVELVLGDRAEVAQHVREVDAVRRRVGAHALLLGDDAREVLGLLEDPQGDGLLHVGRDRDGLVGRAVPAHAGLGALVPAGDQVAPDPGGRDADHVGDPPDQHGLLVVGELVDDVAVDRDHPGRAVGDQRPTHVVDDQAALRLHDDLAHGLRGGLGVVLVALGDLEVVQPREQGREQRERQHLDADEAEPSGARPLTRVVGGHQARDRSGSSRRNISITGGSTNGVSTTSQTTLRITVCSRSGMPRAGSLRMSPVSAKTEVPTNDDAATVATTVPAVGRPSRRTRPATYPTTARASAQRPATWSAGGARSRARPAAKPRTAANCGPRVSAAPTTTSRHRFGTMPSQARWEKNETWSTRARTTAPAAAATRSGLIAASRPPR